MPRRKDNEIYKYKLKNGKVKYGFKTYIGTDPESGKPIKPTRQGFDSYKEAEAAKTKLKEEGPSKFIHKQKIQSERKTVQDAYDAWLEIYKTEVRGSTLRITESNWKNNLQDEFGDKYIYNLSIDRLQKFATKLAETHITYSTILSLLHRIIKYAIMRDWCDKDPFDKIIIPRKSKAKSKHPERNYYSLDELKEFLKDAKEYKEQSYVYFLTVGSLGCRPGEALALKWKDINFTQKKVFIRHSIDLDENNRKHYGPTKTPSSVRKIPLSDDLAETLKEYKAKIILHNPNDFIFHKFDGDFYHPTAPTQWIGEIYKRNDNLHQITPHGFRHTLATLLNNGENKASIKDVQYLLGHKDASTTLDVYTHFTEENAKNVSDSINDLDI